MRVLKSLKEVMILKNRILWRPKKTNIFKNTNYLIFKPERN